MMKKGKLVALAAAASLLLVGIGAGAANADASRWNTYGGVNRVLVQYFTSTDKLTVYDAASDGYGGRSFWNRSSDGANGNQDNDTGAGTTTQRTIGGSGNITFNSCVKSGATTINCSANSVSAA